MVRSSGNAVSLAAVAVGLVFVVGATFSRELASFEWIMLWKVGLLAITFFAFRMSEVVLPSAVSIVDEARSAGRE